MNIIEFFFTNFWHWLALVILVRLFRPFRSRSWTIVVKENDIKPVKIFNPLDPHDLM